jgi:hypothetical protein
VSATRRRQSPRRMLATDTANVVRSARKAREALLAVVKLAERRRREVVAIDEAGFERVDWARLSTEEQAQSLHMALTWLQQAEAEFRHTRLYLERAIERAERQAL